MVDEKCIQAFTFIESHSNGNYHFWCDPFSPMDIIRMTSLCCRGLSSTFGVKTTSNNREQKRFGFYPEKTYEAARMNCLNKKIDHKIFWQR